MMGDAEVRGIPVFVSRFIAADTAYLIDMDVPNRPRPHIITDSVDTIHRRIREWEEYLDNKFLKSMGILNG